MSNQTLSTGKPTEFSELRCQPGDLGATADRLVRCTPIAPIVEPWPGVRDQASEIRRHEKARRHLAQPGALDLGAVGAGRRRELVERDAARRHLEARQPGGAVP